MKSATTWIALTVILSCFFSTQAISKPQQPDMQVAWTSVVAWPIASPQPVLCTDDKIHLVYELLVMNVSSSAMTLDRLETLDASRDDAGVNTKSGDTIVATLQGADLEATTRAFPSGSTRTVGPFQLTRIFLDVTFAKNAILPKVLKHRFQVTFTPAAGTPPVTSATVVSGRTDVTNAPAIVIGPPLEGPRWVDAIGCCSPPSVHRTATLPINGKFYVFERFAIDFAQLDPENKLYAGPREDLSSYAYVGAKVLAVADGTVVNLQDGRPEETPPNFPQGYDLLQQLGNFVIIDIGHGHFAFYAHFQPNTLKVRKGDKVRRGQVLALVGNSGNSDAPHLHFGIEDGPLPFASNGVPFVFSSFTTTGTVTNPFDDIAAGAPAQIGTARAGPHQNELPLENEVLTFPKQ
jgi:murein DD-endopeptidase MepM/ murein hydrolase activator NlpD